MMVGSKLATDNLTSKGELKNGGQLSSTEEVAPKATVKSFPMNELEI